MEQDKKQGKDRYYPPEQYRYGPEYYQFKDGQPVQYRQHMRRAYPKEVYEKYYKGVFLAFHDPELFHAYILGTPENPCPDRFEHEFNLEPIPESTKLSSPDRH